MSVFGSPAGGPPVQSLAPARPVPAAGMMSNEQPRFGSGSTSSLGPGSAVTGASSGFAVPSAPIAGTAPLPDTLLQSCRLLDTNAPEYPFVFFSFNRREESGSEQTPPEIPPRLPEPLDQLWSEAVQCNPDPKRYAVVRIVGFQALQERVAQQTRRLEEIVRTSESIEQRISRLRVAFEQNIGSKLGRIRSQQSLLETQFLSTIALLECTIAVRVSASTPSTTNRNTLHIKRDNTAEARLCMRLEALRREVDGSDGLRQRALMSYSRVVEGTASHSGTGAHIVDSGYASAARSTFFAVPERVRPADTASEQNLREILDYERQGMEHIRQVLEQDRREVENLRQAARALLGPAQ
jgi:hypothetical protein